jgi:hypothetical protein
MFFIIIFLIDCAYMGKFYFDFAWWFCWGERRQWKREAL